MYQILLVQQNVTQSLVEFNANKAYALFADLMKRQPESLQLICNGEACLTYTAGSLPDYDEY